MVGSETSVIFWKNLRLTANYWAVPLVGNAGDEPASYSIGSTFHFDLNDFFPGQHVVCGREFVLNVYYAIDRASITGCFLRLIQRQQRRGKIGQTVSGDYCSFLFAKQANIESVILFQVIDGLHKLCEILWDEFSGLDKCVVAADRDAVADQDFERSSRCVFRNLDWIPVANHFTIRLSQEHSDSAFLPRTHFYTVLPDFVQRRFLGTFHCLDF